MISVRYKPTSNGVAESASYKWEACNPRRKDNPKPDTQGSIFIS